MAGNFFDGDFFAGGFFGAVIPPSSVYYGVGHPVYRRKRKKYDNHILFADIEQSLRALVYGPLVSDDAPVVVADDAEVVVTDVATALRDLETLAEGRRDLQRRVAALRRDLDALAQEIRAREQDEDDTLMLVL